MNEASMQGICEKMVDESDSVLGCALVDMATALPVASDVKTESVLTEEAMMVLFSAASSYFQQSSNLPGPSPDVDGANPSGGYPQEIQTTTQSTFHFMAQVPGAEHMLLVLVTDRPRSSLGLGWMAMHRAMDLVRTAEAASEHAAEPPKGARAATRFPQAALAPEPDPEPEFRVRNTRGSGRRTVWNRR